MKFATGRIVETRGVAAVTTRKERKWLLDRYTDCDWGTTCDDSRAMNDHAVATGMGDILATYKVDGKDVWIKTEHDRSATTILLPSEW